MTRRILVAALACAALPTQAEVASYSVEFLGAGWTGTGMNARGDVCGSTSPDGTTLLAGISRDGQPFDLLPLPSGMQSSRAFDINGAGVIVGAVCPNQYVITQPTAAVWRPDAEGYTVELLGVLPGDLYSAAYAINDVGDIVGGSGFWGWNPSNGVRFTETGPVLLPDGMMGVDVNNQRVVLTGTRLLDLDTGSITDVPLPPGNWNGFIGAALNENSDFCGYIVGWSGCSTFPMRYRQSTGWEYLGGCATTTSATAINDLGDALLYYYMTTSGVSFVDEGYFVLGSLIDSTQGEWYVQYGGANAINNSRQIVAGARQGASGPIGTIRMTPLTAVDVAEAPATPSLVGVFPNPSNGRVHLTGPAEVAQRTDWAVFDVSGRRCGSFRDASWDGTDDSGHPVPAGVYFVRSLDRPNAPRLVLVRR